MKTLVFIFLFSFNLWATECESLGIQLQGEVKFVDKSEFNLFPKKWNVNSDYFDRLYLINKSQNNISRAEISSISLKKNIQGKFKKNIKLSRLQSHKYLLEGINFKRDIIKNLKLLPMIFTMKIKNSKDDVVCSQAFQLEVIE